MRENKLKKINFESKVIFGKNENNENKVSLTNLLIVREGYEEGERLIDNLLEQGIIIKKDIIEKIDDFDSMYFYVQWIT